ncbi:hypothetical protein [Herpetosiphon gulosus]|uniref:Uncharacterized protein n=1 Tax=Herpetosiphon gulosus TaxID=1973496 RepID=A0ABP9WUD6_9CHLR
MWRSKGVVLASVVVIVLIITTLVPNLFERIDGSVGSYLMVGVALAAVAAWWWRRKQA